MKKTIWHKLSEQSLLEIVEKMGYGDKELITFQKRRLRNSILIMLAAVPPGLLINKLWFFSAIPAFLYIWYSSYAKAKREYKAFRFNKQILFSRFMRLVMPYLKEKHNTNYGVFKRLHKRLDEKSELKKPLETLMVEINEYPNSLEPYTKFASETAGTDQADSFMTTLYDYQQFTSDDSIITELGRQASDELFEGVDEIIKIKLRKFSFFPTKLTLANFILLVGYMAAIIYNLVTEGLKFS